MVIDLQLFGGRGTVYRKWKFYKVAERIGPKWSRPSGRKLQSRNQYHTKRIDKWVEEVQVAG